MIFAIVLSISMLLVCFASVAQSDTYHILVPHTQCPNDSSCLTLSQLAENVSNCLYFNREYSCFNLETTFVLHQGNHILKSEIVIKNASNVSIIGSGPPSGVLINCEQVGQLSLDSVDYIQISNLVFDNCRSHQIRSVTWFILKDCIYQNHTEAAMKLNKSSAYITSTSYISNSARYSPNNQVGAAMTVTESSVAIENSTFRENSAERGGAIFVELRSSITVSDSKFMGNHVIKSSKSSECFGGAVYVVSDSELTIINCEFHNSSACGQYAQGGVIAVINGVVSVQESVFAFNKATEGGVMFSQNGLINISASTFRNNTATYVGAVLHLDVRSLVRADDTVFVNNKADQGIIYLVESACIFGGNTEISHNMGSLLMYYSNATFKGNTTFISNMAKMSTHFHKGGAITAIRSSITFEGRSNLSNNTAENGGAIHVVASKLYVHSSTYVSNNNASECGGGIYLFLSELKCEYNCTLNLQKNSAKKGGGAYATASIVTAVYGSQINFTKNTASMYGGGVYLEVSAKLNILIIRGLSDEDPEYTCSSLLFIKNSAEVYGGAVYVADEMDSGTCNTTKAYSTASECFLQAIILSNGGTERDVLSIDSMSVSVKFVNNHALQGGFNLFGGLLDRCTPSPFADRSGRSIQLTDSFTYFQSLSNVSNLGSINSRPVRVCFCNNSDSEPDCSYQPPPFLIQRGETITVSLVAVDQANHSISAEIHSFLSPNQGGNLGEGQSIQNATVNCTNLNFTIASPLDKVELTIYADGPCKDAIPSLSKIQINFTNCTCPIGFQQKLTEKSRCVYECDTKLTKYNIIADCDYQTKTLERATNSWIGYSINYGYHFSGYLIHLHCPQEYCKPPKNVLINLSIKDGADVQCTSHRSGVLCGTCQADFSISLGSSNCIPCPSYWPALFIGISIVFFLSGILLVTFLLALNLTVAVGTLNGIIFYANIVDVNKGIFFGFSKPNFATVFISWLNLDIGFDVCFIKNLNAYWKTWLQLAFPTYVIFLVVMVIIIGQRSKNFSQLIGRKNPVATLATLIFLSYAKFLSTIIVGLSCTSLIYSGPDGEHPNIPLLWLSDASVRCFSGSHLVLFIAAVFILLAGIAYTVLLFSWQWLLYLHNKFCGTWVRIWILKLSMFIETYHAPYIPKNRYWTGLLLLVRVMLYIASTANVSDDPRIDLLITGIALICILLLKEIIGISGRVYKKWPIEILEISCYVNLILFCFATLFALKNENLKASIAYTSVSITFVLFLGVLLYHAFTEVILKTKIWKRIMKKDPVAYLQSLMGGNDTELRETLAHTSSVVEEHERSTSIHTLSEASEPQYFRMEI